MSLTPGTRLGTYEILEIIGAGGMGEVYRARDSRLGRDVAIKILRQDPTPDAERLKRFEQEARAASALNHPNIVTIHEIGEHEDTRYIVMEFIAGETLRELVAEAPLSTKEIVDLGAQIAGGMAKAHGAGIVHRDLKPENIIVSDDGFARILDFGLAKLRPEPSHVDLEAATQERLQTREGVVVGTTAYMSPEQAKGQAVDFRSDQFALGVILFEMAAGRRPFDRGTVFETLTAIVKDDQEPVTKHNPAVPGELSRIIDRCLSKDPRMRYDSTRDLARDILDVGVSRTTSVPSRRRWVWPAAALAILLGILALNVDVLRRREDVGERPPIRSIAVLPLSNLSADPEQDYFADGMTEALITDLAKIGGLKVVSRTSIMRYKGSEKPLREVAEELDVEAVVEGSVLRAGDQVRITAQLIHGATDTHLWAESYDRDLRDVLSLQGEVARTIAGEIRLSLTPEQDAALTRNTRIDLDAYDAYLLGRHHWNQGSPNELALALDYFQQSVDRDPSFARAYAGLAETYLMMATAQSAPKDVFPKAKAMALRALEIDRSLGEAHTSLAWSAFTYDFDWAEADRRFRQAIQFSPGYATSHLWYGVFLSAMGDFERARGEMAQALELDPLSPVINATVAFPFFSSGEMEEAIDAYRRTLAKFPGTQIARVGLSRCLVVTGAYDEAIAEIQLGEPRLNRGLLGMAYGLSGRTTEAQDVLKELTAMSREGYVPAVEYVYVFSGLRDKERALDWLERGYDERGIFAAWLKTWPLYDPLRDEPRFKELLARMQLPN